MAETTLRAPGVTHGNWRATFGRRAQLVALVGLLVLIGALAGDRYALLQSTPQAAVQHYLDALSAGDATSAWPLVDIAQSGKPRDASLTDRAAFKAAVSARHPSISAISVGTSTVSDSTATVTATYRVGDARREQTFQLKPAPTRLYGLYQQWVVTLTPVMVSLTIPPGSGGIAVDGISLDLATGKSVSIAVLPLPHRLELRPSQMVDGSSQDIDSGSSSAAGSIAFSPKLTAAGLDRARQVVKAALSSCATLTSLSPTGCPQSASPPIASQPSWQLVGDPTADLTLSSASGALNAIGHFAMVLTYRSGSGPDPHHVAVAGGYAAPLQVSQTDVSAGPITGASGLAAASRPAAATDQAALTLVREGMTRCGASTSDSPPDCPQLDASSSGSASNVRWSLTGDPTSGATVNFDPATGLFYVAGAFAMGLDYDSNLGSHFQRQSFTTKFRATLVWDGSALQLVTIEGDF
jgi:hypothetical protein